MELEEFLEALESAQGLVGIEAQERVDGASIGVCLRWGEIAVVIMPYVDGDTVALEVVSYRDGVRQGDMPELLLFG